MVTPPPAPSYEERARRDRRLPVLVGLGLLCAATALIPALSFVAPPLCIAVGATAGALFGLRAGGVISVYTSVLFLTASAFGGATTPARAALTAACTLLAGAGIGRASELLRLVQLRALRRAVTGRQAAEGALAHAALLRVLPDAVCRVDRAGNLLEGHGQLQASPKTNVALGVGKNLNELLPRALAKLGLETLGSVLEQRALASFEFQLGEHSRRTYEARVVPSGAHDVLAVVRDVSELKQLQRDLHEAQRDALAAAGTKGRFLATMSHRIRTPMNGVIGMTNVLLQTRLTPEQREYTTIIRNSGEALLSILDDVLDYTRIEDGQMKLFRGPFALRELLDELVELLAARAHAKGLEIAAIIDPRVPAWVQGDRGRLRQVVINLLGNAIKFTHEGHVVLRAAVVGHERDTALIRFDVCDTGVGIPAEYQKNLFQDYSQAHRAVAREYGGTGLGLVISRQIVELMGGRMVVESGAGSGSMFSFTARFTTIQDRTTRSFVLPRTLGGAHLISLPLHPLTRELIEHQLAPLGAKLVIAESSAAFGYLLRKRGPFDVALIELPLGTRDAGAAELVAQAVAQLGHVPLVALCALGQRSIAEHARRAGAATVLTRPMRRSSLYDGLVTLLGLSTRPSHRPKPQADDEAAPGDLRARVLVAEDNLVNQKVAVRTLELLGCHVEVAENGALALDALAQGEFDAVLMDCQMPVLDGFDATRQLRALEGPLGRHTPVIAVTANAMQGDRERCLQAGMDDYLAKPVTMTALDEALRKWVPHRPSRPPRVEARTPAHEPASEAQRGKNADESGRDPEGA
jgi:signal transduction histidine kinase/CheY-like chemotaxis protein